VSSSDPTVLFHLRTADVCPAQQRVRPATPLRRGAVIEIIPETLVYHRMRGENVTRRHTAASRDEFLAFVKASLDRRRRRTPGHDAGR
jgi:hypothetical protein